MGSWLGLIWYNQSWGDRHETDSITFIISLYGFWIHFSFRHLFCHVIHLSFFPTSIAVDLDLYSHIICPRLLCPITFFSISFQERVSPSAKNPHLPFDFLPMYHDVYYILSSNVRHTDFACLWLVGIIQCTHSSFCLSFRKIRWFKHSIYSICGCVC